MRRFLAAVLASSLPLLPAAPAGADGRTLQYAVVSTIGGVSRQASVTVDFIGGSADRVMNASVGETDSGGERVPATVGIEPSGSLRANYLLTDEEDAICSLMALESEDMDGVGVGDHWDRGGPVPGGMQHTRFNVLHVRDGGLIELSVAHELRRDDGRLSQWNGTMLYNATDFVPSTITLRGNDGALTIRLVHDTFKHY